MADGKKSFLLYCDLIHTVRKMPMEKAGELFMTILEYVNDEHPEPEDMIVQLTFEPIKQQLKRDLVKWEDKSSERSQSGRAGNLKRYNSDLYDLYKAGKITLEKAEQLAKDRKTSLSDNSDRNASQTVAKLADSVTVSDSDTIDVVNTRERYEGFKQQIGAAEYEGWRENFYMKFRVKKGSMSILLNDFVNHLCVQQTDHSTLNDFQGHFYNWVLRKQSQGDLADYIPGQRKKGDL